jgi:glycosyltransferase involved in cell wall biosynthesis
MKFSIITTVYNSNKYIHAYLKAINSINYNDFELIIINDGSNDDIISILEENLSPTIDKKIIHQSNKGIFTSLVEGVSKASGDYISIIDSDDFVSEDILLNLEKVIVENNPDLILFKNFSYAKLPINSLNDTGSITNISAKKNEILKEFIKTGKFGSLSEKCFKKSIFLSSDYQELHGLRFAPDIAFSLYLYLNSTNIWYFDKTMYFAPYNNNSTNKSFETFRFFDISRIYSEFERKLTENKLSEEIIHLNRIRFINDTLLSIYSMFLSKTFKHNEVISNIKTIENDSKFFDVLCNLGFSNFAIYRRITLFLLRKNYTALVYLYNKYLISKAYKVKYFIQKKINKS